MPHAASTRPHMKREHEPSLEDAASGIVATTKASGAPNAPPQRKRQQRVAAPTTEVKTEVKEEDVDMIPPEPETGPKPECEAKVEAKAEPHSSAAVLSRTPAKRGCATITRRPPPAAGPSPAPTPSEVGRQVGAPTPSENSPKAAKKGGYRGPSRAVKAARLEKWKAWCHARKWICQHDPGYKHRPGDVVAHRSDAMSYYRFEDYEIDTIPYVPFDNKHNQKSFGRAYNNSNLHTLVSRKLAYLAGLDEQERFDPKTKEVEFLKEGWKLFEAATKQREENMRKSNKTRKPLKLWRVRAVRTFNSSTSHHHGVMKSRPFGSWSTRVYEGGEYVGDRLNFQFDPLADDYADFYGDYERFWPRGADWAWELGGLCSCCDCDL